MGAGSHRRSYGDVRPTGVHLAFMPPSFDLVGLREGTPDFAVVSLPAAQRGTSLSMASA